MNCTKKRQPPNNMLLTWNIQKISSKRVKIFNKFLFLTKAFCHLKLLRAESTQLKIANAYYPKHHKNLAEQIMNNIKALFK